MVAPHAIDGFDHKKERKRNDKERDGLIDELSREGARDVFAVDEGSIRLQT